MEKEDGKGKVLQHSEKYFQGYWVQLQSRIRKEDDADELLEGTLSNPLEELRNAWNAHHENHLRGAEAEHDEARATRRSRRRSG